MKNLARATTEHFVTWLCDVIDLAYEYYGVISIADLYEIFKQYPDIEGVKIIKEILPAAEASSSDAADPSASFSGSDLSHNWKEDSEQDWEDDVLSENEECSEGDWEEDSEEGRKGIENLDEFTDMVHYVLSINENAKGKIPCRIDGDDVVASNMSKEDIDYIRSEMKLCGIEHSYIPTL